MQLLKKVYDNTDQKSVTHNFRSRRFQFFMSLLGTIPRPISILDIGGTQSYWQAMGFNEADVTITLLNLDEQPVSSPQFRSIAGDATGGLPFADQFFDIVYSNSVIEHLFTWEHQQKMATEVKRLGKRYFIQTPNYWFPVEPHWVFPLFQYLPVSLRVFLTHKFSLGHIKKAETKELAQRQVDEIKLLTISEMTKLFPEASIYAEKFCGLTKSFIAYKM
jgi:SAM-dependent methyltransferase